jgi:hypothetical protein
LETCKAEVLNLQLLKTAQMVSQSTKELMEPMMLIHAQPFVSTNTQTGCHLTQVMTSVTAGPDLVIPRVKPLQQ